jgi:hypothetical protein
LTGRSGIAKITCMKESSSPRMLVFVRRAGLACVALLLLFTAVRASWATAQHVMLPKGREHGMLSVVSCADTTCTGPYDPDGAAGPRDGMKIESSVAVRKGDRFPVVVEPGTDELVRTDAAGLLHAWGPLGGALLLVSLVIGAGLRLTRTAWATGLAGGALLLAAFLAL